MKPSDLNYSHYVIGFTEVSFKVFFFPSSYRRRWFYLQIGMVGVPHRRCGGPPDRVLNHFLYLLPMLLFVQLLQKYLWLPMLLCSVQRKILQTLIQLVSKNILVLISIFLTNEKLPVCFDFQSVIFDCLQVYNNPCQNVLNYKNSIKIVPIPHKLFYSLLNSYPM